MPTDALTRGIGCGDDSLAMLQGGSDRGTKCLLS